MSKYIPSIDINPSSSSSCNDPLLLLESGWWERGKVIGEGSYGCVVYEARPRPVPENVFSLVLPKLMAVKTSPNKRAIYHERDMLSLFKHNPYIIQYYGLGSSEEKEKGIIMQKHNLFIEYASGGDMSTRIFKWPAGRSSTGLPAEKEVRGYLIGILLGLQSVHRFSYAHCDIKPENILIVDGIAKIADFGLALKSPALLSSVKGTREYMAPELITEKYYTCSADVWALGITVLEMLIGKRAWGNKFRKFDMMMLSMVGECNIVPEIPTDRVSYLARDFLSRCLVRDYKKRWTVDMLLNHPFVLKQFDEEEDDHHQNKKSTTSACLI